MDINNRTEVRKATSNDIYAIKAQMRECIAIHVAVLGGETFLSHLQLADALEARSKELECLLKAAENGEQLELHLDGGVPVTAL